MVSATVKTLYLVRRNMWKELPVELPMELWASRSTISAFSFHFVTDSRSCSSLLLTWNSFWTHRECHTRSGSSTRSTNSGRSIFCTQANQFMYSSRSLYVLRQVNLRTYLLFTWRVESIPPCRRVEDSSVWGSSVWPARTVVPRLVSGTGPCTQVEQYRSGAKLDITEIAVHDKS
jgi:hypothetical protein